MSPGESRRSVTFTSLTLMPLRLCMSRMIQVSAFDRQRAVVRRDIGEPQDDVATFAATDEHLLFQERDRVAAAQWNEFTVHGGLTCSVQEKGFMMPKGRPTIHSINLRCHPHGVN